MKKFNWIKAIEDYSSWFEKINAKDFLPFPNWLAEEIEVPHCAYCMLRFKKWEDVDSCGCRKGWKNPDATGEDYGASAERINLYLE